MNRFDNGFHSFKKAINRFVGMHRDNKEYEYVLKDVIIDFHHAIEVLFKDLLHQKNEVLIYSEIESKIEKIFAKKMNGLDDKNIGAEKTSEKEISYTITFDDAVKRVIVLYGITIDGGVYYKFKELNKLRNSLIHDEIDLIRNEVEQLISGLLPTVIWIFEKCLPQHRKNVFVDFIEQKSERLAELHNWHVQWKIDAIISLLRLNEENNMQMNSHSRMILSYLGYVVVEDNPISSIDKQYFISLGSWLQRELCHILLGIDNIKQYISENKGKKQLGESSIVKEALEKQIENIALEILVLLEGSGDFSKESIKQFMGKTLLINQIDIFEALLLLYKVVSLYAVLYCKERREKVMKTIKIGERELTVEEIYRPLIEWYNTNEWYNTVNQGDLLTKHPEAACFVKFVLLDEEFLDLMQKQIDSKDIFNALIDDYGELASIDHIDGSAIKNIAFVICNDLQKEVYTVILNVSLDLQTYFDHDHYDNESEDVYVFAQGQMQGDKFVINEMNCPGKRYHMTIF